MFSFSQSGAIFGSNMSYISNGCIVTKERYDNSTYPSVIGIGFYISRYTCLPEQLDYCSVPPAKAVLRIRNSKNELLVEKQLEFDAEVPYNEPTLSSYVAPVGKIKVHPRKKPNDNLTFDVEFDENI